MNVSIQAVLIETYTAPNTWVRPLCFTPIMLPTDTWPDDDGVEFEVPPQFRERTSPQKLTLESWNADLSRADRRVRNREA